MDPLKKQAEPATIVIFGATGDLTARRLVPAIYNLAFDGELGSHFACVGFARREKTDQEFRLEMREAVTKFSRNGPVDEDLWNHFSEKLHYHSSNFDDDLGYIDLKKKLEELDALHGTKGNRVYYLSTQPKYFPLIAQKLKQHGLLFEAKSEKGPFSRVIIEKPFGHDYDSALELQKELYRFLDEDQIYRIDHYLGKEPVQNLLAFRFLNPIFENLWNRQYVDWIEILVAEDQGIGTRGNLWEESGMLRDMVQNHLMQLLSLTLMEPPVNFTANGIRDEKVKVLDSIRLVSGSDVDRFVIRGQYGEGIVSNKEVIPYREEKNVNPHSSVETYVALKLFVDNWRWAGVPIYLRNGKRLTRRTTEIVVTFKGAPKCVSRVFHTEAQNQLVIQIQPDEGISLNIQSKVPNLTYMTQTVKMDFKYGTTFGVSPKEAYERLIYDCLAGDTTLFTRADEVLAAWKIITPLLDWWKTSPTPKFPNYLSGSNGPDEAASLLEPGHFWRPL